MPNSISYLQKKHTAQHREKKKYKTWSNVEGKKIKAQQEQEIKKYIRNFKCKTCAQDLVIDFQNSALQTLCSRQAHLIYF